jgi:probable F420-dependent oxidoreductase
MDPEAVNLDWFSLSSFIAAQTSRLRLRTYVFVLPMISPLLTAKLASTIDYLSNGRLELGLGSGWLKEEFADLGVPWRERGRRTTEYIRVLRTVWGERVASYEGEFVRFDEIHMAPKPVQDPLPLYLVASNEATLRRVAALGDGWLVPPHVAADAGRFTALRELLPALLAEEGREAAGFPILMSLNISFSMTGSAPRGAEIDVYPANADTLLALLDEWAGVGVTGVDFSFSQTRLEIGQILERTEWLAENVVAPARLDSVQPNV